MVTYYSYHGNQLLPQNGDETSNKSAISLVSNMDQVKGHGDKAIYRVSEFSVVNKVD